MGRSRLEQWTEWLILLVYVGISIGPVLFLIQDMFQSPFQRIPLITTRQLVLLGNSILYAAVSAWVAMIIGVVTAIVLWSRPGILSRFIKILLIIMLPMPAYVHAAGWRAASRYVNDLWGYNITAQGWGAAVVITVMAFLPIAVGAAWLGLRSVDADLIRAGRVCKSDIKVFGEIILPLAMPFLVAGGTVIMALSLLDYTIPSLCQVNVFALEIFADFSAGNSPGRSFLMALPLIIVNTALVVLMVLNLRGAGSKGVEANQPMAVVAWPTWFRGLLCIGVLIALVQAVTPILTLIAAAVSGDVLWKQIGFTSEMGYSMGLALGIGTLAVILAYPVARNLIRKNKKYLLPTIMLPLVMPAPLTGIGLVKVGSMIPGLYGSDLMPVMAGLARFLPLAVLIIWAGLTRVDPLLIEAGRVMQVKPGQAFFRIELGLLSSVLAASFLLIFALSLGELGSTLMVVPPGRSTLTITIYNYLHYGASGSVAALCLITALLCCLIWGGGMKAFELLRRVRWSL